MEELKREICIVFDGPPGPLAGRFVEAECEGKGINAGKWREREDGMWELVLEQIVASKDKSNWDPEKFRRELTTEKIIEALRCYLPEKASTPPMPTAICIEEAIRLLCVLESRFGVMVPPER